MLRKLSEFSSPECHNSFLPPYPRVPRRSFCTHRSPRSRTPTPTQPIPARFFGPAPPQILTSPTPAICTRREKCNTVRHEREGQRSVPPAPSTTLLPGNCHQVSSF